MASNIRGRFLKNPSSWRKVAAVSWSAPDDSTIYGTLDLDMTNALEYLETESERSGQKLTVTHLIAKATAEALKKHPECNALIRRDRIYLRDDVDIFVHVAIPPQEGEKKKKGPENADLSGALIRNADRKGMVEMAAEIVDRSRRIRNDDDPQLKQSKKLLENLPPPLLKRLIRTISFLQYEWNLDLSAIGFPRDSFGSAMVTSVGMFGIEEGFAPITPFTHTPILILLGKMEDKPVARDGQVVIRPMLKITGTFDHRLIDGFQAGRLATTLRKIVEDPAAHFGEAGA